MRISDWSSDVCSSDLFVGVILAVILVVLNWRQRMIQLREGIEGDSIAAFAAKTGLASALIVAFSYMLATYRGLPNVLVIMFALIMFYRFVTNRTVIGRRRSEEHTSELQSLMRISYAVFCLKKKNN